MVRAIEKNSQFSIVCAADSFEFCMGTGTGSRRYIAAVDSQCWGIIDGPHRIVFANPLHVLS